MRLQLGFTAQFYKGDRSKVGGISDLLFVVRNQFLAVTTGIYVDINFVLGIKLSLLTQLLDVPNNLSDRTGTSQIIRDFRIECKLLNIVSEYNFADIYLIFKYFQQALVVRKR